MLIAYQIDREAGLVTGRITGRLVFDDIREVVERMLADPDFDPSFMRLWEVRDVERVLTGTEVRRIADLVLKTGDSLGGGRVAVVTDSAVYFGLGRMLSTLSEGRDAELGVFRDRGEAMTWLQGGDASLLQ